MKRITALVIAVLMLACALFACTKDDVDPTYPTRAAAFYGEMKGRFNNNSNFWFEMVLTQDSGSFVFKQATNGAVVTTIKDYTNDALDSYEVAEIKERGAFVHSLNIAKKTYDTTIGADYQRFLFADYTTSMFSSPISTGDESYDGAVYYCETYETSSVTGGEIDGSNKYYFDGGKLIAIEIYEQGKRTMVMHFNDYGTDIPSDIYLSAPDDFGKGTIAFESVIDYTEMPW